MSNLLKGLKVETNKTHTLNGAEAFKSTTSKVLDLFALGGSMRGASDEQIYQVVSQALSEDLDLGLRTVLYLGDIRGGQGERNLFKVALKVIRENYGQATVDAVIRKIPELTRWDYLFEFMGTTYENYVLNLISDEVDSIRDDTTSLVFKWLPSIQRKPALAKRVAKHMGMNNKEYRQMLSRERAKLRVVEVDMSAKNWEDINYEHVPSKASMIYRNAFRRNDEVRYEEFINKVQSGEAKINAGTLYPHEIVQKAMEGDRSATLDALWNNLPDYVTNKEHNVMPLIDVSGSMNTRIGQSNSSVRAIHCSIGLGMYLAERTEGYFKNHFITFSANPNLDTVQGDSIYQRTRNLERADWGHNTDFIKVFKLLLDTARVNNLTQEDMPDTIVVFSDMEFDEAHGSGTPFDSIKLMFENEGFRLPQIVYWNLDAKTKQHPVTQNEKGAILVSGYSPSTLTYVLTGDIKTPYELMLDVIMNERYKI